MSRPARRRAALLGLVGLVALLHGLVAWLVPLPRIGDGAAERMPARIEVAYVRELTPAPPPVVAPAPPPRRRAAPRVAAPASAASAVPAAAETGEAVEAAESVAAADAPEQTASAPLAAAGEPAAAADAAVTAAGAASTVAAAAQASAAASAAVAATPFEWPPSTRLTYSLFGNYRGEVTGNAMVEWVRAGTRYQVHLDVWIGAQVAPLVGRRMTSDGELTEAGLVPQRYDEETRALFRELRRRTIRFDGDRVLLPNGRQPERPAGVQDAASQFVQLTWLFTVHPELLRAGRTIELPLALPTKVVTWSYDIVGTDVLDTPLGPVETFHVRPRAVPRPGGDLVAEAWFAPTLAYLPIRLRIRQDEATYVDLRLDRAPLQAVSASGLAPASASAAAEAPAETRP
jgi:hypothetical protein